MSWHFLEETWSTSQDEKGPQTIWSYCHRFYNFKTFVATKKPALKQKQYLQGLELQVIYGLAEQDILQLHLTLMYFI